MHNPIAAGTPAWLRVVHARMRVNDRTDPAVEQLYNELAASKGSREAAVAFLHSLEDAAACEDYIRRAEAIRTQRLTAELADAQARVAQLEQHITTTAAGNPFRDVQPHIDAAEAQLRESEYRLPPNQVGSSEGGSSATAPANTIGTILANMQSLMADMLTQTVYAMQADKITLEDVSSGDRLLTIVQHVLAALHLARNATQKTVGGVHAATLNTQQLKSEQQGMQQTISRLATLIEGLQAQLASLSSENNSLREKVEQLAAQREPEPMVTSENLEEEEAASEHEQEQEQLEKPTDELPDGFSYGQRGGSWLVFKTATGASCTYQAWKSAGPGTDPFGARSNNTDHGNAKVSLKAPKSFSGDGNEPRAPELAIHQLEHYFKASNYPESEWGLVAGNHLSGAAEKAYNTLYLKAIADNQVLTWDKVRELIQTFRRSGEAVRARQELSRVKQTTTVAAYNHHFDELLSKVPTEDRPARYELMSWYISGLIKGETTDKNGEPFTSLEHAMKFHLTRERAHMEVLGSVPDRSHNPRPTDSRTFKRRPTLKSAQVDKGSGGGSGGPSGSGYPPVQRGQMKTLGGGTRPPIAARGAGRGGRGRKPEPDIEDFGGSQFERNRDKDCPFHKDGSHTKGQCKHYLRLDKIWQQIKKSQAKN